MEKGQAERLMPLLAEVLAEAGVALGDVDAIGVGIGPGNFTGIRLSVAAARGLALALRVPAIGVSGFDALREGLARPALACIDARRDMVFADAPGFGVPRMIRVADVPADLLGSGLDTVGHLAQTLCALTGGAAQEPRFACAVAIGRKAAVLCAVPQPRPAPLYLRPPDAAPGRATPALILP